jgi:hypothetical protein
MTVPRLWSNKPVFIQIRIAHPLQSQMNELAMLESKHFTQCTVSEI